MELRSLVKELEEQKYRYRDIVANTRDLAARPDVMEGLVIDVRGFGSYVPTDWAHGQIAEKHGIPKKYYDRMRQAGRFDLLADNINAWFPSDGRRLIRTIDDNMRAYLSDRFRCLDNYDLLFMAMDEFERIGGIKLHSVEVSETMLYIKAISENLTDAIKGDDVFYGGIIIRNSEVGASSLQIQPFAYRVLCRNGLIGDQILRVVHVGSRLEEGVIDWSDRTRRLEDELIWSKAKDAIRASLNPDKFMEWMGQIKQTTQVKLPEPTKVVDKICATYNIPESRKEELLLHFEGDTQYDLVNAITRTARDIENPDDRVKMEEFGGLVLRLKPEQIGGELVEAAEP